MSSLTSLKTSNEETTMAPDAAVSEYKVAYNYSSRQDFVKEVNALIKEGWRPQGGAGYNSNDDMYFQAMVR